MPLCGGFSQFLELAGAKERTEAHADPRQRVRPAVLAIDDAHRVPDEETLVAERGDGLHERAAGSDHVLDKT